MNIIYLLIPIAIILTVIGIYLFFWAVKTEQFNDLEKQGLSILFDDENDIMASEADKNKTKKIDLADQENQDIEVNINVISDEVNSSEDAKIKQ